MRLRIAYILDEEHKLIVLSFLFLLVGDRGEEFYQSLLTVIQDYSLKFRFSDPAESHIERAHAKPVQSLAVLPPCANIRIFLQPE